MLITALVIACIAITAPIWAIEAKRKAREDLADRQADSSPWGDVANIRQINRLHNIANTPEG